jgi:hypothetical protein
MSAAAASDRSEAAAVAPLPLRPVEQTRAPEGDDIRRKEHTMKPVARTEELLIEQIGDEAMIYDKRTDTVHHLDARTLAIWRACDGRTTITDLAGPNEDVETLELALAALQEARLLMGDGRALRSRRQLLFAGALVAATPMVTSIVAPTPAVAATSRVASGISGTNWEPFFFSGEHGEWVGIFIDVDTSTAQFTKTPVYVTSLYGNSGQWATTGGNAVYSPTATGFRVYVRWSDGRLLTPAQAVEFDWRVAWHGIEN